jgi:hypothetical protein
VDWLCRMFTTVTQVLTPAVHRYQISDGTTYLTFAAVMSLWQTSNEFRDEFINTLQNSPFRAYFFETPPITHGAQERDFEFVLVDSPSLSRISPEENPFPGLLQTNSPNDVKDFFNLGKDAKLVVPCPNPGTDRSSYSHLSNFVRNAPSTQVHNFFAQVGQTYQQEVSRMSPKPIWLSTSGLGVYWLHMRICKSPKYYTYQPYIKT